MFLTGYPHFHWTRLRIYGVLTRIAICYLLAGLICLATQRVRTLLALTASLLVGYWLLMRFVPVPGLGVPTHGFPILDPDNNLAAWLDRCVNVLTQRWLHTGRLYQTTRDPEGLLSTIPALATTLIGVITALCIRGKKKPLPSLVTERYPNAGSFSAVLVLVVTGALLVVAGRLWNVSFPINKNLWTSSYVLYAAGWSLLLLALLYYLIDIRRIDQTKAGKWLLFPWLVFGSNAIFAFVFSNFIVETLIWIKVPSGPKAISAWLWIYTRLFARTHSNEHTSLAFALAFVVFCFLPTWLLYRKRIFLKI
jgi:predicted acyltransferase